MVSPRPRALRLGAACLAALALGFVQSATPRGASPTIVISQVYGGGGNFGATYTHDYIELFNRSNAAVDITGWSVQYASSTGSTWQKTDLSGTIPAGGYYLVQQAQGAAGTTPLPAPDAAGSIPMSASAGKVLLATTTTAMSVACPSGASVVDFVGFGAATCSETSPTAALSNTTAAWRNDAGCQDTDSNAADFTIAAPAPRNGAAPVNVCGGPPPPLTLSISDASVGEGASGTISATFTVSLTSPAPAGGVTFDIATADGTATSADGDYTPSQLLGRQIPEGESAFSFTVLIHGDTTIEPDETFSVAVTNVVGATILDGVATGTILNDDLLIGVRNVVISQLYGAGGNSGALFTNDFVELFNREPTPVSLSGWSIQYASSTGTSWTTAPLSGSIAPGGYYLVQLSGGANGSPLPAADATGTISMAAGSGKVALVATTTPLSGACPATAPTVADFAGYGTAATCFEGAGPTATLSATLAAQRRRNGCFDSNSNTIDFALGAPAPRTSASPAVSCELLFTTAAIHAIQGDGLASPFAGQDVETSGIVTARKTNGFFLQTPDDSIDANPATSEALFVFTSTTPGVIVGDLVSVKGTATEFFALTQIESPLPGDVTVVSSGHPLPAGVLLTGAILSPTGTRTQLEPLESMRVHADSVTSVGPTNEFGEIYTVLNGVARPLREPGIEVRYPQPPDPETGQLDCCVDIWDMNPERLMIDTDGLVGSVRLYVTSNVTLGGVSGPLDFSFGDYKVLPEAPLAASPNMAAVPVPAAAANEFTVAGYNIENFTGNETQRRKAALHIRTVMRSPDVIGVIEIGGLAALQSLAAQVNADATAAAEPNPLYEARLIPFGGGTQHVGYLVKTSRVRIDNVIQARTDDVFINPNTGIAEALHDRPPLVLDATVDPAGRNPGRILVVVNHLRSFIDIEQVGGDGPRVRAKRKAQAEATAELLQDLQQANPGTPVISVGDYNAYQFSDGYTDPISVLKGQPTAGDRIVVAGSPDLVDPDFVNLTDALPESQRYSFVFEGTPQALDHILVNAVAWTYLQRYAVARSNADFPGHTDAGFVGDASRPEANSDHDTPVAYFAFPGTPVVALNGGAVVSVEAFTTFSDPGATAHDDNGTLPVTVSGSVKTNLPGTYTLRYTATNGYATTTVSRTVIVADTIAPAIAAFAVTPTTFGPANHEMFTVSASYGVSDASGVAACTLAVTSNELANARGDGNTTVDWIVTSPYQVQLRAERAGTGTGRVYTIAVTCRDGSNNSSTATATVTIAR